MQLPIALFLQMWYTVTNHTPGGVYVRNLDFSDE